MKYLRDKNITHRDLKPGNIMKYISESGKYVFPSCILLSVILFLKKEVFVINELYTLVELSYGSFHRISTNMSCCIIFYFSHTLYVETYEENKLKSIYKTSILKIFLITEGSKTAVLQNSKVYKIFYIF